MRIYIVLFLATIIAACNNGENEASSKTSNPETKENQPTAVSRNPELEALIAQGGNLFANQDVNVLIKGPMDESGKSFRMVVYSDQMISQKQYEVYSMELTSSSGDTKNYSATLRDYETGQLCSMSVTSTLKDLSITWSPNQSKGCNVYRWGFDEGTTTFDKVK